MSTAPKTKIEDVENGADSELPEGWAAATLGDVVDSMKNGLYKPASAYADRGVACLRMYNIEGGKIVWKNIKRMILTRDEVDEYSLAPGDLLVNRVNSRELVGKTGVFPDGLESCVYESKNIRVRLISELANSDFVNLQLLLRGQNHFNYHSQQVVGMASISQPQIAGFSLVVAPRAEQERVVAKTEEIDSKLLIARRGLERATALLKHFRQAVLAAACSGKLTEEWRSQEIPSESIRSFLERFNSDVKSNPGRRESETVVSMDELPELPSNWKWLPLASLTSRIGDVDHKMPKSVDKGVPYISTKDFSGESEINFDNAKQISLRSYRELSRKIQPNVGDVLLSRYGTIGAVRLVDFGNPFQASYSIAILKVFPSHTLRRYVCVALKSSFLQEQMTLAIRASSQPDLGLKYIRGLVVPVPPPEEQVEITRRVDALFKLADAIEKRVAAASARAENLTQAILAKAFRGELVSTEAELARREGREYEPASVLLERIKAERATAEQKKPRGKKDSSLKHS